MIKLMLEKCDEANGIRTDPYEFDEQNANRILDAQLEAGMLAPKVTYWFAATTVGSNYNEWEPEPDEIGGGKK